MNNNINKQEVIVMDALNELEYVIDRYNDGNEELDAEQLATMLTLAIQAMQDPHQTEYFAKEMLNEAGYSVR